MLDNMDTQGGRDEGLDRTDWSAVNAQADQRRRMTTPAYMADAIMAAIPEKQTERATMTTTHGDSRLSLTPMSAAAAAAGFTALGVLIGRVIGR